MGLEVVAERLRHLVNQSKELNHTQLAVLTAINNLNIQLGSLALGVSSYLTLTTARTTADTDHDPSPTNAVETDHEPTPTTAVETDRDPTLTNAVDTVARAHGYVNFGSSHDILKTKHWKRMQDFTYFCGRMLGGCTSNIYLISLNTENIDIVNEETRFPGVTSDVKQDVYINVNNPQLKAEILYIVELERPTPDDDIKRLWQLLRSCEMHTRCSFEEKYGLKWLDPVVEPVVDPVVKPVVDHPKN